MLYGQIVKEEMSKPISELISVSSLKLSEKERLVKLLFTGVNPHEAQKQFFLDSGAMIHPDEVKCLHDELFAYAEENKPLVSIDKSIVDIEVAKDVALKESPVEIIKGK